VYLGEGVVYVGSHSSDSQLIRLQEETPKIKILQSFENLAPLVDFRLLDMSYTGSDEQVRQYSPGHTRIVTASGGFHRGGLRSVRSGVGLEDMGVLGEMEGIRGLWGLKSIPGSTYVGFNSKIKE
jgi:DNA damage-binding protein 1